jgi:hypothetical protein
MRLEFVFVRSEFTVEGRLTYEFTGEGLISDSVSSDSVLCCNLVYSIILRVIESTNNYSETL